LNVELALKPLQAEDYAVWSRLWRGYQSFYKAVIPDEVSAVTWGRILDASEPVNGLLAWQGDQAVGLVHFIWHRSTWTSGDYCYLQDLFVDPEIRGAGIGRRLIEAVYAAAEAKGCSRVHWLTHETNETAMQLYDRIADRSGFLQYRKVL
jgi:GNAT superfamily N-acetyltransferase